jgi:hypothetical protein
MFISTAVVVALLTLPPPAQPAGACLHEAGKETPEHRDRSVAALAAARAINTAQAAFAAGNARKYATRDQLQAHIVDSARYNLSSAEITPGFALTLDAFDRGYWFEIVDMKDPCRFRYVSNQSGLILAAQPIR